MSNRHELTARIIAREALNIDWCDIETAARRVAEHAGVCIEELEAARDEALNQLDSALHSVSVLEKRVEELEAELAYWQADSAAAWDKCEERRLENARLREIMAAQRSGAVWVCPDCDIVFCKHYRAALNDTDK